MRKTRTHIELIVDYFEKLTLAEQKEVVEILNDTITLRERMAKLKAPDVLEPLPLVRGAA